MALTDARIRNLKPRDKPYKTSDYDGLYILTNPNGSKLWRLKYRFMDKERLLSIGKYPTVGLSAARQARDDARSQLANGEDPNNLKREMTIQAKMAHGCSFSVVAEQYMAKIIKEGRAEVTLAKIDWLMAMANADFGQKPITEISAPMVLHTLKKVENKGNYETAKRLRSQIGAVFPFAIGS